VAAEVATLELAGARDQCGSKRMCGVSECPQVPQPCIDDVCTFLRGLCGGRAASAEEAMTALCDATGLGSAAWLLTAELNAVLSCHWQLLAASAAYLRGYHAFTATDRPSLLANFLASSEALPMAAALVRFLLEHVLSGEVRSPQKRQPAGCCMFFTPAPPALFVCACVCVCVRACVCVCVCFGCRFSIMLLSSQHMHLFHTPLLL
jgi:hypothetical protein